MITSKYWVKIAVQALVIFGVGFGAISVFRSGKQQVRRVTTTNADLSIPLPFLPFNFDGTKLGNLRRIVVHRSSPEQITGVDVVVRVADAEAAQRLGACPVTVDNPTRLNENSSFECAAAEGLEPFGLLIVQSRTNSSGWHETARVPILLPKDVTGSLHGREASVHAAELERDRFRQLSDSAQMLARAFATASDAEARESLKSQLEDLEDEMRDLRESIVDDAKERAAEAVEAAAAAVEAADGSVRVSVPGVKIEINSAE
ncbi:MAG: hypothetical protein AB7L66_17510 [Gemmatimonadales bacterium]